MDVHNDQAIEHGMDRVKSLERLGRSPGPGVGRALAGEIFSIARARGLRKLLADGSQSGRGSKCPQEPRIPDRGPPLRFRQEREWLDQGPGDHVP